MANDLDQARGRVFQAIRDSIELGPDWESRWKTGERELLHLASGSVVRAIANDFRGEAGANHSLVTFTELWGYTDERSRRLYEELTPVPTRDSTRFVETYAGFLGESELLWELYERGVMKGRQLNAGELHQLTGCGLGVFIEAPNPDSWVPVWIDEASSTLIYWDQGVLARRMPWQQGELGAAYYAEQEAELRPAQNRRLHLNEWVTSEDSFIDPLAWERCGDLTGHPLDLGFDDRLVLAVDASTKHDTTAIVGVTRHPDRRSHPGEVVVRVAQAWTPSPGEPMNYQETIVDVIKHVEELWGSRLVQIAYDPFQLHDLMRRIQSEMRLWTYEFEQGAGREQADKQLRDLIVAGRVHYYPSHMTDLSTHVLNANSKFSGPDGDRLRIVKRSNSAPIDLAVALSMATHEALRLNV